MTAPTHRAAPSTGDGAASSLSGLRTLIRLVLRRDRIRLPAWIAGHGLLVVYIGAALPQLAPQEEDLGNLTVMLAQPVGRMFTGPAFGLDAPTYERFFAAGYMPYLFLLSALMNIFLITRHTRGEEQSGRAELIRANVTGRHTALTAALAVALLANAVVAPVVAVLAVAVGYAVPGSLLAGLATSLTGMVFAGVAAVTSQLSEFSRAASGMAGAVLGVAFLLRALGDMVAVGGSALSWVSPLGWAAQTAPYVHDRWAPLVLSAALALAAVALAFELQRRRDFSASFVATRPGRAHAHPWLGTPTGLAARLQCGGLLGWGTAILLLGIIDGAFTQAMIDAGDGMPDELSAIFGTEALVQGYTAFLGSFVIIFAAAYAVYAMQTLRAEEGSGRADAVLATPVSRVVWSASHVLVIAVGILLLATVTGLGTGLATALVTGDGDLLGEVLLAHLAVAPAALCVLGLCTALFGWLPRLMAALGWVAVAVLGVVELFAALLDLPDWLRSLSPLHHLAAVPVEEFALTPFLVVTAVAVAAVVIGLLGLRRRQLNVT
ncbi:ABC transporter permease [Brachybacterium vulturis]|uniref:ABC transporter permease n=1 Tax=Brachybacterium vulturis TaxID=2017484 RepID=UPI00373666F1